MHVVADSLNGPAHYFDWGWLSVSVPNLIVILVMIALFVLALVVPFPTDKPPTKDRP
jgi:hypothetical protein